MPQALIFFGEDKIRARDGFRRTDCHGVILRLQEAVFFIPVHGFR